jgi:putative transposase
MQQKQQHNKEMQRLRKQPAGVTEECGGYYAWLVRPRSKRDEKNEELTAKIREVFAEGRHVYGTRRITKGLAKQSIFLSRKLISRLMMAADLSCKTKRKFKVTTDTNHNPMLYLTC